MGMVVKNNMSAISTLNTLNKNSSALSKSLQKVSSGMKINSAADDASGYAISERMRVQIRGLDQANSNTQNGSSMMKVAEGAVSSTVDILKTLKEKVINAANDSNTDSDRQTIQKELDQSIDQINDNANVTFNGKYLVDGSKNTQGQATFTALTNQSLSTDTKATTKLTDLKSRSGDELEISTTDKVTVSYVQAGKTYTTSFNVTSDTNLKDIFDAAENIDTTSTIFGTKANDSIAKANGTADSASAMSAAKVADNSVTVAQDDLNVAQTSYSAAQNSLSIAQSSLDAAQKAYDADKTAANSTNLSNAKADMNSATVDMNSATADMKKAQASFDAAQDAAGPALLDGAKIGVAASGDMVSTADGNNAITVTANKDGVKGQISGLSISITDSNGNVKKSANAALDNFNETIRAQNKSEDNAITLQVGTKANQSIKVGLTDMRAEALGLKGSDGTTLNISTQAKANAAINVLDNAVQKALDQQTTIGSVESRLEYTSANLTTASENVQSSESTIRDANMAKEMTEYTKNNVLMQAAQSMLAQANQSSSSVLSLLQ